MVLHVLSTAFYTLGNLLQAAASKSATESLSTTTKEIYVKVVYYTHLNTLQFTKYSEIISENPSSFK